ncbi:MAG: hypothetical protein RLZZ558_1349 [Planctomycetota bacterium]|jgi:hypothetical protein
MQVGSSPTQPPALLASAMRSIRIPLGFLWVLGVLVLLLMVVAYAFGHGRGKAAGFQEGVRQQLDDATVRATSSQVRDPLALPPRTVTDPPPQRTVPAPEPSPAPTTGDPRQKGLFYFVLVTDPSEAGGRSVVDFCRASDLDAHLVFDNNGKSRKVIVLPALATSAARSSREGRDLEARIKAVGRRWQAKAKGNRNFDDTYLVQHR